MKSEICRRVLYGGLKKHYGRKGKLQRLESVEGFWLTVFWRDQARVNTFKKFTHGLMAFVTQWTNPSGNQRELLKDKPSPSVPLWENQVTSLTGVPAEEHLQTREGQWISAGSVGNNLCFSFK